MYAIGDTFSSAVRATHPAPSARNRAARPWAATVLALFAVGCGGEVPEPTRTYAPIDASALYWALTLDHHAVTLSTAAPWDTLQLTATLRDASGAPLAGSHTISFRSTNPSRVQVDATGRLQAIETGTNIRIIAEATIDNVRHADTTTVNVRADTPAPLPAVFSIHPADSTVWPVGGNGSAANKALPATVLDASGRSIPGVAVYYTSLQPFIAIPSNGALQARQPGEATIVANATIYGVPVADTVTFTIIPRIKAEVDMHLRPTTLGGPLAPAFEPRDLTISVGGAVLWRNGTGRPMDVTFDDPTNVTATSAPLTCGTGDAGGAGNIPAYGDTTSAFSITNCRSRRFMAPGVYSYHSTATGAAGRITVVSRTSAP